VRPAAILGAGGGRPVPGHGEAAAERHGDPDGGRPVRFIRGLPAADGQRRGQAERARQIRHPGSRSSQPVASSLVHLCSLVDHALSQADNLQRTALQQMHKILTTQQAARGLLALGDYFQRLRALSRLWAARPRESAMS
jgi:hypothetical protein